MEEKNVICDIDGVLLQDNALIEGSDRFIRRLEEAGNRYLLLTNYPSQTPQDIQNRLRAAGLDVPIDSVYTSAMATAAFSRLISSRTYRKHSENRPRRV